MLDKDYVTRNVAIRRRELNRRYYVYCTGKNEDGALMSDRAAANLRSLTKRDIRILDLIGELLSFIPGEITLSDDAEEGYNKRGEPFERDRGRFVK